MSGFINTIFAQTLFDHQIDFFLYYWVVDDKVNGGQRMHKEVKEPNQKTHYSTNHTKKLIYSLKLTLNFSVLVLDLFKLPNEMHTYSKVFWIVIENCLLCWDFLIMDWFSYKEWYVSYKKTIIVFQFDFSDSLMDVDCFIWVQPTIWVLIIHLSNLKNICWAQLHGIKIWLWNISQNI